MRGYSLKNGRLREPSRRQLQPLHLLSELEAQLLAFLRREPVRHVREDPLPHLRLAFRPGEPVCRADNLEELSQPDADLRRVRLNGARRRSHTVLVLAEEASLGGCVSEEVRLFHHADPVAHVYETLEGKERFRQGFHSRVRFSGTSHARVAIKIGCKLYSLWAIMILYDVDG